jgi:hypothetical protein
MPAPVQDRSRAGDDRSSDRYEPLPGIAALPGWLWRRLPPGGKVAVALLPFVVVALVLLLGPGIDRSKDERARAESQRLTREREQRAARLRAEQRPRFGRGAPAGADLGARAALLREARVAVETDARRRAAAGALAGPIRRATCEPFPRSVSGRGAHLDPRRTSGRYACLAVTREVPPGERAEAAAIGHPYRVRIDFGSGRYAFCKVTGRAGEGAIGTGAPVTVPRVCGGR